MLNIQATYD